MISIKNLSGIEVDVVQARSINVTEAVNIALLSMRPFKASYEVHMSNGKLASTTLYADHPLDGGKLAMYGTVEIVPDYIEIEISEVQA